MSPPVDWLPEIALAPDHAPEARQEVALAEDQVSVEAPPLETDVGFAASDTVGSGGGGSGQVELSVLPPHAAMISGTIRPAIKR